MPFFQMVSSPIKRERAPRAGSEVLALVASPGSGSLRDPAHAFRVVRCTHASGLGSHNRMTRARLLTVYLSSHAAFNALIILSLIQWSSYVKLTILQLQKFRSHCSKVTHELRSCSLNSSRIINI
ncbi:hypothetical protein EV356DRAFT_227740 [Viridothelium virens]|uniref:Uncharacterized protein n=1 Tax=Viridothelium virens TaxID=1048519 RepID=A0A6A6HNJ1_VIRVR|nr:hypothetical protein EV356DRAFT_227740 [Viridothelium virens]